MSGNKHAVDFVKVEKDNNRNLRALVRDFKFGAWKPNVRILTFPNHLIAARFPGSQAGTMTIKEQQKLDTEVLTSGSQSALGSVGFQGLLKV